MLPAVSLDGAKYLGSGLGGVMASIMDNVNVRGNIRLEPHHAPRAPRIVSWGVTLVDISMGDFILTLPFNSATAMIIAHNRLHETTRAMDQQEPPEFLLDVFADPRSVREVVKESPRNPVIILTTTRAATTYLMKYMLTITALGILHTIFFHRFFPSLTPQTREVLDLTLPYVDDDELETMIEQRVAALERQLDAQRSSGSGAGSGTGGRGQLVVQFFEKRRRKAWLSRGDEEVCWECWTVKVTVAEPRTESGTRVDRALYRDHADAPSERAKVRRAMEQTLLTTAMKIVTFANTHKDHIPPITTQGTNPFPYKINLDQKEATGWATRMRIY
ncbi:hypothetical protein FZEAL_241 [Fusarium zealandicum]|uniref:Autophagy-related protein 101 n=1 Tax=Fusarium zealandicum TaxID=1053134 RepID=A0A8H4XR31_9HYPO|nr:hypothetical protein FZEAL_241 [Fusarium zealandicum]